MFYKRIYYLSKTFKGIHFVKEGLFIVFVLVDIVWGQDFYEKFISVKAFDLKGVLRSRDHVKVLIDSLFFLEQNSFQKIASEIESVHSFIHSHALFFCHDQPFIEKLF